LRETPEPAWQYRRVDIALTPQVRSPSKDKIRRYHDALLNLSFDSKTGLESKGYFQISADPSQELSLENSKSVNHRLIGDRMWESHN
jgi:hypothetical protein